MEGRRPKNLVLILAREFASKLATASFVCDGDGRLVYFNEAAEEIVGRTFAETGEVSLAEWSAGFAARDAHDSELKPEERPIGIALVQRRPAHGTFRITGLDGVVRDIAVTAFPLFAHADELVGVVSLFWQAADGGRA
jgi:PAS domain-containing protein